MPPSKGSSAKNAGLYNCPNLSEKMHLPGTGTFESQLLNCRHRPEPDSLGVAAADQPVSATLQYTYSTQAKDLFLLHLWTALTVHVMKLWSFSMAALV